MYDGWFTLILLISFSQHRCCDGCRSSNHCASSVLARVRSPVIHRPLIDLGKIECADAASPGTRNKRSLPGSHADRDAKPGTRRLVKRAAEEDAKRQRLADAETQDAETRRYGEESPRVVASPRPRVRSHLTFLPLANAVTPEMRVTSSRARSSTPRRSLMPRARCRVCATCPQLRESESRRS